MTRIGFNKLPMKVVAPAALSLGTLLAASACSGAQESADSPNQAIITAISPEQRAKLDQDGKTAVRAALKAFDDKDYSDDCHGISRKPAGYCITRSDSNSFDYRFYGSKNVRQDKVKRTREWLNIEMDDDVTGTSLTVINSADISIESGDLEDPDSTYLRHERGSVMLENPTVTEPFDMDTETLEAFIDSPATHLTTVYTADTSKCVYRVISPDSIASEYGVGATANIPQGFEVPLKTEEQLRTIEQALPKVK